MVKKTVFRAAAVVGGCLVSLLLVELLLRVSNVWIGRHSDTMFTVIGFDATLGWKMKPNINEKIDLVDVEGIPVRSNSAGFWDKEFVLQKPLGRCRIAFLGDSLTWGMGAREEERFTNLLAIANPDWESLNFGIPGYGTDQSLLVWQHIAHHYQPDLVILTIYQNDYVDNMHVVRYGRRKPYFELNKGQRLELRNVPVDSTDFWHDGIFNQAAPPYEPFFQDPLQRRSRIVHWFAKNSDLVRLSYTLSRFNRKADHDEKQAPTTLPNLELTPAEHMQVKLLSVLVEELAGQVKAVGARLAVILSGDLGPQYRMQKKALSEAGIICIDATTDVLAKELGNSRERVYYPYSGHWTPGAHGAVAILLAKGIRERGLCPERRGKELRQ
jgi:hypothetical protein